jgi:hypothetical protein
VLRPRVTAGWYWAHELAAAIRAGFIAGAVVFERWRFEQECHCPPPLAPIAELYKSRLAVGKNTPAGKAKKLVYNSGYGKFAQSVGEPVFANPVYASAITAGCRTMALDAIAAHPSGARELLMVATDSVTFSRPHSDLPLDPERLGAWTETRHENLSLFMPGVYWDDAARQRIAAGEAPVFRSRGIAARDLARRLEIVDRAWTRYPRDGWPRLVLPVSFQLVSPRQALERAKLRRRRHRWAECGTVITRGHRIISADPQLKRFGTGPGRSQPYKECTVRESTPYQGSFGDELRALQALEFGDHPDGPVGELLADILFDR